MTMPAAPLSLADLETFDARPQGQGRERRFLCPECGEGKARDGAHRSLAVNMETGAWQCWRCKAAGKLTDHWRERPRQSHRMRSGVALHRAFALDAPQAPPLPETAHTWREHCHGAQKLPQTPGAAYLESRGIIREVLPRIARTCLYHPALMGRPAALFPFYDPRDKSGEPLAVAARYVDGKPNGHRALGAKSLGVFYTMPDVWAAPVIVLVEAPLDALSLMACGVPAVALGGVSWPDWLPVACGFKSVLLAFDADEAGDKAAAQLAPVLASFGAKSARLRPPGAKDWNEELHASGTASLSAWLRARCDHAARFDFQADSLASEWWPFAWFTCGR